MINNFVTFTLLPPYHFSPCQHRPLTAQLETSAPTSACVRIPMKCHSRLRVSKSSETIRFELGIEWLRDAMHLKMSLATYFLCDISLIKGIGRLHTNWMPKTWRKKMVALLDKKKGLAIHIHRFGMGRVSYKKKKEKKTIKCIGAVSLIERKAADFAAAYRTFAIAVFFKLFFAEKSQSLSQGLKIENDVIICIVIRQLMPAVRGAWV